MSTVRIRIMGPDGYPLAERSYTSFPIAIGRDPSSHLILNDPNCSRRHAVIDQRGGEIWYTDVGSSKGSWGRTGERVTSVLLSSGGLIRIGSMWLEIRCEAPQPLVTTVSGVPHTMARAAPERLEGWDENVRSLPLFLASLGALGFSSIGLSYESAGSSTVDFCAYLFSCGAISLLCSAGTYGMARLFRRDPSFKSIFLSYWFLFSISASATVIDQFLQGAFPDDQKAGIGLTMLNSIMMWGVFLQNFRWIFGVEVKWPRRAFRALASLTVIGSLALMAADKPRWKTVAGDTKIAGALMRAPASSFVTTDQLMKDIDASLGAVTRPSTGPEAD